MLYKRYFFKGFCIGLKGQSNENVIKIMIIYKVYLNKTIFETIF